MKKTVEVEYVGIEDLQDILDDIYAIQREGHFVAFRMSNTSDVFISIDIYLNGWGTNKDADFAYCFYVDDKEDTVKIMNECKNTLKNLLIEGE